eukprot:4729400-Amphidinium_carterae.1
MVPFSRAKVSPPFAEFDDSSPCSALNSASTKPVQVGGKPVAQAFQGRLVLEHALRAKRAWEVLGKM